METGNVISMNSKRESISILAGLSFDLQVLRGQKATLAQIISDMNAQIQKIDSQVQEKERQYQEYAEKVGFWKKRG